MTHHAQAVDYLGYVSWMSNARGHSRRGKGYFERGADVSLHRRDISGAGVPVSRHQLGLRI